MTFWLLFQMMIIMMKSSRHNIGRGYLTMNSLFHRDISKHVTL